MSINRARARRRRQKQRRRERERKYLRDLRDFEVVMDMADPSWRARRDANKMMEFIQESMRKGMASFVDRVLDTKVERDLRAAMKSLTISVKYVAPTANQIVIHLDDAAKRALEEAR